MRVLSINFQDVNGNKCLVFTSVWNIHYIIQSIIIKIFFIFVRLLFNVKYFMYLMELSKDSKIIKIIPCTIFIFLVYLRKHTVAKFIRI